MRKILFGLLAATLAFVPMHDEPVQNLIIYGGGGGTSFSRSCGNDKVLVGFEYRAGLVIDALSLICRPVNSESGALGNDTQIGTKVGGSGGTQGVATCASGNVVVGLRIDHGSVLNGIRLTCRNWRANLREWGSTETVKQIGKTEGTSSFEKCTYQFQPAVGIRGRSGMVVDAIGLVCNEP
jgi:hypothetical protein